MKKILALVLFAICLITLSCEKELDVKLLPEKPLLVLSCPIVSDSAWAVSLTRTGDILDYRSTIFKVDDAQITILNEKNEPIEKLEHFSKPGPTPDNPTAQASIYNYRGKTAPVAGKRYSVQVHVEGEPDLYASGKIPLPVTLSYAEVDTFRYNSKSDVGMRMSFQDPVLERNYYQIRIYREVFYVPKIVKNGVLIPDSSKAYFARSYLSHTSEGLIDELDGNSLIADDLFNGKKYEVQLKVKNYNYELVGQTVHVMLLSISKEYYDYFTSLKAAKKASDNPQLAQPVQIYTNIENGLGIFAGYSVSEILLK